MKSDATTTASNYTTLASSINLKANASDVYTTINTYTKTETDVKIAALVDSAPSTLDTLKELAAALGNDQNFSTSVATAIGTKQPTLTVTNSTASPLTLSNNILTIDLSNYSTTASINSLYQKILTVTNTTASPLTLSNNILTVDLLSNYSTTASINSLYQKILTVTNTTASPLTLSNNILTVDFILKLITNILQSLTLVMDISTIGSLTVTNNNSYRH